MRRKPWVIGCVGHVGRGCVHETVSGKVPQKHIADGVAPVEHQSAHSIGVSPMPHVGGQAQAGSVLMGVGAPQKTLGSHVAHPPGQAGMVGRGAVGLHHDKPIGPHWNQQAQPADLAAIAHPVNRSVSKAPKIVAQGVPGCARGTPCNDFSGHGSQVTRQGGPGDAQALAQSATQQWACGQSGADLGDACGHITFYLTKNVTILYKTSIDKGQTLKYARRELSLSFAAKRVHTCKIVLALAQPSNHPRLNSPPSPPPPHSHCETPPPPWARRSRRRRAAALPGFRPG